MIIMQGVNVESFDKILLRLKEQLGVQADKDIAKLLGMTPAAFNARKKRGSFPEDKLLALVARRPELLIDVNYVLTGRNVVVEAAQATAAMADTIRRRFGGTARTDADASSTPHLTADELELLELFRAASLQQKMEAVRVLSGGGAEKPTGKRSVKVSGNGNRAAGRDYHGKE